METLYTIGFTKKNLPTFVELLRSANVTKLIDIRLRNTSQLAGYAKREDLAFVLDLCGITYEHVTELAPSEELLDEYRENKDWERFEQAFRSLLQEREPLARVQQSLDGHACVCLLCTEDKPERCHRRLVAEYIAERIPDIEVKHL